MDIIFAKKQMRDDFNNTTKLLKKYGKKRADRIISRMSALRAASCLEDLRFSPGRFHELKGDRAGQIACDLDHPYRLIFTAAHDPKPVLPDETGLNWQEVTIVKILGIEDYH